MPLEVYTMKLCSRLYSTEIEFYFKKQKNRFWATFGELRGNVRTPSIARWKARDWFPIRHNWTFFTISYGWDLISGNMPKQAFFKEVGNFECKFQTEGVSPTNHYWCQKLEWLLFRVVSKYPQCIVGFCHKARGQTAGWTDRITTPKTAPA